jgi:hypothetical protein
MKLSEVLTGPETWCYGWGSEGRYCLLQALSKIVDGPVMSHAHPENQRLQRVLGTHNIVAWNDASARTWDEVASVVDAYDRDRLLNP